DRKLYAELKESMKKEFIELIYKKAKEKKK
ncbi:MAG: hypothetical protein ACI8P3_003368, partial [Saprospiraceae bacterium]